MAVSAFHSGASLLTSRHTSHSQASSSGRCPLPFSSAQRPQVRSVKLLVAASNGESPEQRAPVPVNKEQQAFGSLEKQITSNLATMQPGLRDDWHEVEGCWVLGPPRSQGKEKPKAVLQFIGGAFVGAAPQLSYRLLLESLAAKGLLIIAAPYPTGFDHLKITDEVHFKLERATQALSVGNLPVYGLGHSLGSLIQVLIGASYPSPRNGNIFMSFNNKNVLESVPFFAPFIAPGARALAPILSQLATSPFRSQLQQPLEILRGLSPGLVRQALPILDQLLPLYMDVADGRQEFHPSPEETQKRVRGFYGVPRNLIIQFESDVIDESKRLSEMLSQGAVASELDLTFSTLPGDHIEPLQQRLGDLPPQVAEAVSQGNQFLDQISQMAGQTNSPLGTQFQEFAKGLSGLAKGVAEGNSSVALVAKIERLAEEITSWIDTQSIPVVRRQLPPADGVQALP